METITSTRVHHPAAVLAVLLMAQLDATIVNVATPAIRSDLGAPAAGVELVIGGYLVAFAVILITGARLGQIHGYKRVFLIGIAVFGVASLACGLAPNTVVLVIMRVIQGIGAALMFPQTLTGVQLNFNGHQRVRALSWYAITLSAGAVSGQRSDPRWSAHLRRCRWNRLAVDLSDQRAGLRGRHRGGILFPAR